MMREIPRDLVVVLRTEARNQRNPPIDYAIASDGGRMVVRAELDIAMAELLEEVAAALAAKNAEIAALKKEASKFAEWVQDYSNDGHTARAARSFLDKWEGRE